MQYNLSKKRTASDGNFSVVGRFLLIQAKVKCTLVQALRFCTGCTAHRGSRGIALLFLDHCTRKGEWPASRPDRSLPPGKTRYPLHGRLSGSQGRSGQVRKISPPSGFDPRTVQPVASRYTNYTTRSASIQVLEVKLEPRASESLPLKTFFSTFRSRQVSPYFLHLTLEYLSHIRSIYEKAYCKTE